MPNAVDVEMFWRDGDAFGGSQHAVRKSGPPRSCRSQEFEFMAQKVAPECLSGHGEAPQQPSAWANGAA